MDTSINLLAVLVAAVSAFVVGGLWYGPVFGKSWQRMVGLKDSDLETGTARVFGGAFVLTLIMSITLAFFIGDEGLSFGLFAGLAAGLGWVATAFGVNYLFERRSLKFFLINAGYNMVIFTLMGAIIGAIQ